MDDLAMSFSEQATCRICRSEGTPEEPLFHPCRCSGSIRNVHQECLVEWLTHSQKKHCELCKTPFRFTKLYDAHMPEGLPWRVFLQRAVWDLWSTIFSIARTTFVVWVWLIILPWLIRWAWRWMFWFADAGWARDEYLRRQYHKSLDSTARNASASLHTENLGSWTSLIFGDTQDVPQLGNSTAMRLAFGFLGDLLISIGIETFANTTHFDYAGSWKQPDSSVFSSFSYLASLTPYAPLNRIILDIFEGQLITCTVIISFILIFLIREWVVQQQPLANLEPILHQHDNMDRPDLQPVLANGRLQPDQQVDDRYRVVATRIADLRADIEADIENLQTLQDRMQAQRQEIQDARRPEMPDRGFSSRATHIQRALEETNGALGEYDTGSSLATPLGSTQVTTSASVPQSSQPSASSTAASTAIDVRPITNAGVDARMNIKWRRNVSPATVLAPSENDPNVLTNEELSGRLGTSNDPPPVPDQQAEDSSEEVQLESFAQSLAEIAQLEDEGDVSSPAGNFDQIDQTQVEGQEVPPEDEINDDETDEPPRLPLKRTLFDEFADWFWSGIEVNATTDDQVIVIDERRLGLAANEAPFVPVNHVHEHHHEGVDPEVAAAAQQAGLDPDLGDGFGDAGEEMEGLLELVGLRGPLVGMIQTSLFCLLLVISTVLAAVVIPYVWGKVVLSFIGSPVYFLIVLPLRAMSFMADFIVDATLCSGGWLLTISAVATEAVLASISTFWPRLGVVGSFVTKISNAALMEASASGDRLRGMFSGSTVSDPFNFNEGILGASAHAHLSLKELTSEVDAIMNFTSSIFHQGANIAVTGNFSTAQSSLQHVLNRLPEAPLKAKDAASTAISTASRIFRELKNGNIALPMPEKASSYDPALIYWNSSDRSLAVTTGYFALAALAAIFVASNVSFTSSPPGRRVEKVVRDSLRQAGGVLKVILIISIEMLVFPTYCGMLLDFAFLPLFGDNALTARLAFAGNRPYIFCFVHWFLGTYYMFHFALFVGMCRKILRKGVLWFIRDPDDPTFHPVRDVLERNVVTQLRKIAFSALVYGALVILCLGGVIWSIGKLFKGIFPIVWRDTEPVLEFPVDLFLYNFLTPLVIAFVRPSEGLQTAYAWWLRRCARLLRLSHFLFGERMKDEEGYYVFPSWTSMVSMPAFDLKDGSVKIEPEDNGPVDSTSKIRFVSDGRYVFTPCNDQYRPPKPDETFFTRTAENDVDVVDQDGKHHQHWSKVYLPPYFKTRIMLFMVCLWIFSAFAGLCVTLVPLAFGRRVLGALLPGVAINDIYAYSIGAYVLGGSFYLILKGRGALLAASERASQEGNNTTMRVRQSVVRLAKCAYVYGYIFAVQPLLTACVLETYVLMPLHTFLALKVQRAETSTSDMSTALNVTALQTLERSPGWTEYLAGLSTNDYTIAKHDIHLAQDIALAILMIRLVFQFIAAEPRTRAAEALRRVTKDGIFSPDAWIVTRYLALPTIIVSATFLIAPIIGSNIAITLLKGFGFVVSPTFETLAYRFSYPTFEALIILLLVLLAMGGATARWRSRIRDEVYLVGERLHNFGEKKPPAGTRSIMRRERGAA